MEGRAARTTAATDGAPLVGRREALRVLDAALDAAIGGSFRFLALSGDPGAGKTRLLGELAAAAGGRALPVLAGRAAEFEQQMPFAALVDALDDQLEERRPELDPATARLLSTVFPALAGTAAEAQDVPAAVPAGGTSKVPTLPAVPAATARTEATADAAAGDGGALGVARYQLHRAVRHLLERLAAGTGLVLLLDDVHWADDASIELLGYLVRHPPRARVLIGVAYRPAQASPRLATLVDVAGEHGVSVTADPFTEAEVERFLGPGVARSRCQALYEASGGNPFYLEALARGAGDGPLPEETGPGRWGALPDLGEITELPPAVRTALQVELSGLHETALLVARAAAVAADEFEPALAAAGAELPEAAALAALDDLAARDVVRPASAGRFRFRHPLVRHVVYGSAAAGWRLAAHARIAAYLAGLGAPATLRAHHVERSARYGDRSAITTLVAAARAVAPQAPATAAHWFEAALRLMPEDPEPAPGEEAADPDRPHRVGLLAELAHAQTVSGRLVEGRETTRTLLRLLPPGDHARRARAVQMCAVIERQLHRHQEARAMVLDELHRIPDPQAAAAVLLRVRLVADRLMRIDTRGAQAVLDRMPENAPDWEPGLRLAVASLRVLPAYATGRVADAGAYAEAADRLLTAAPDAHIADALDTVPWLCWTEIMMGRYDDALRHIERSTAVCRATGQASYITYLLNARARACTLLGRLEEAADAAEEATETARLLRSSEALVFGLTQQCLAASWSGEHDKALRYGEEAVAGELGAGEWWGAMAGYGRAVALINAGRHDEGAAALLDACGDPSDPKLDPSTLLSCAELLAFTESGRKEGDPARWAEIADVLGTIGVPADAGLIRLAHAHAARPADPARAAVLATEAAALLTGAGRRLEAGRAELAAGMAHHAAGDREPARARLRAAAALFEACGAAALTAQTVREQRRLGVRVAGPRPGGSGEEPFGLSPREYEIASLVAQGCTNQQVAEKLFLSVRTVETHLSRVFRKLGVSSRVGVATALDRHAAGRDA
ncbi:AAA family ATPase [Spirillospora sp. NPDC029432]|uniref:helix-turn-helix transcriptional regulator n=1 Tax=Spirillospora sp. NPDC029432 TaxID=3154599 RepID=UPI003454C486